MSKRALAVTLFFLNSFLYVKGVAQTTSPLPRYFKPSWQRLLLQLSGTYFTVVKEDQVNLDSSLIYAASSLGISRLTVVAEGIEDPELLAQSKWVDERRPAKGISMLSTLKGSKRLEQLVLLGAYYAFEPGNYHRYKDSVLYFLNKAIDESKLQGSGDLARVSLCLIGKMYVEGNDLQQGKIIFDKLISQCEASRDFTCEARAWAYRGLYTAYSPATSQDRISYLQEAVELYHHQGNIEEEANMLTDIGYLQVTKFQLQDAYQTFQRALQLEDSIAYPATHYNKDAMAMVTVFEGKFGEPLKYTQEGLRIAETLRDSIAWSYFYDRLGILYSFEGRKEEAFNYFQKASTRFSMGKGDPDFYRNTQNILTVALSEKETLPIMEQILQMLKKRPPVSISDSIYSFIALGVCYLHSDKLPIAEKYLLEGNRLITALNKTHHNFTGLSVDFHFGKLYFLQKKYAKAALWLKHYLNYPFPFNNNLAGKTDVLKMLIAIDSIQGNANAEIKHYQQYTALLDSNFKISTVRQAEELQVKYQTQEKESEINLLNQKAAIEQAHLKEATMIKNVTIGGIALSLIIAGLLFRQNRLKQKNNKALQHLLIEKEWLLKEVHHRVKNNLHTVICLLESQAAYLENDALKAIEKSQHRIYAMSLIHQKLYQSEDIKTIDMQVYINEFTRYLMDSFDSPNVKIQLQITPLKLDVAQAIPVGLIINEAITNSYKYAFPAGKAGEITLQLTRKNNKSVLIISDNGIGITGNIDDPDPGSLGIELMKGLAKEIDGEIFIENHHGTKITVSFTADSFEMPAISFTPSQKDEVTI